MKSWKRVDFPALAAQAKQSLFERNEFSLMGGQCAECEISELILQWDLASMPFRIWEYSSEIIFEKDTLPKSIALLERGRLFGEGGDLMLRRNGTDIAWRFIGPAVIKKPVGNFGTNDYWQTNQDSAFHQEKKTALLWGEWNGEIWIENRVGSAKLNYPINGKRIQLDFKIFTQAGFVEFVWFTGLSEWEG
jgi:hypothetical protein